jgi:dolichol-phosphate mannosyltransferase
MDNQNVKISVVVPVYKSAESLVELHSRLVATLEKISSDFEIILINDGSPQNDWEIIKELTAKDGRVKGVNFSKNFGQHNAIFAGLSLVQSDWTIVMDCDLQDKPEEITKLYAKVQEGFDIVLARRKERQDNAFRRVFSALFYKFLSYLTGTKLDSSIANFGIYRKTVIKAVLAIDDYVKYFPAMVGWVGFKSVAIDVEHALRLHGKTSYSYRRLMKLAWDVAISFSNKPLKLVVKAGMMISVISLLMIIYYAILYFKGEIMIVGWASLILSLWFLFGVLIFVLGIVGLYIGKIFDKVKNRPNYIIKDLIN